jgi:hypothetical protein
MSKRKMCPASQLGSQKKPSTGLSAEKSAIEELRIFRGTPRFEDAIVSAMFGVSLALGAISRAQEVLLDKIESTAAKVETLRKEVQSMKVSQVEVEMNKPDRSWLPSDPEIREWLNLPIPSPERICSPELTCSEMPFLCESLSSDLPSTSDGYMDLREWVNLD